MHRLVFIVLLLGACDETSAKVRYDYVERHRDAFVFEGTTHDYVLRILRDLLAEQGFALDDKTLQTARRKHGDLTEQYAVHVIDMRWKQGFLVHLVKISRDADGNVLSSTRSTDLEWELIQRADPDHAMDILSHAADRADKVAPRAGKYED